MLSAVSVETAWTPAGHLLMMALLIVGAGGKYSPLVIGGFGILEKHYRDGTCFKNIDNRQITNFYNSRS